MFWKAALNYSFLWMKSFGVTNQTILKKYNPRHIQTSDSAIHRMNYYSAGLVSGNPTALSTG